ncbi:MAG: hypothetical protein JSV88_14010 [Candidatus Aminicenantes bacterium]|nr:MAG: hypothetical protein JSV88_14010 [Candidatus Aminicenantes bacterium]
MLKKPPETPYDYYCEWISGEWILKQRKAFEVDESGFLKNEVKMPLPYEDRKNRIFVEKKPPDKYEKPRWNGKKWEDSPVPTGLYIEVFDQKKEKWVEGGKGEELANLIDAETDGLIKNWCRAQKKNEEYYINKGIENSNDPEYIAYKKEKNKIILGQKNKKIAAGVYKEG